MTDHMGIASPVTREGILHAVARVIPTFGHIVKHRSSPDFWLKLRVIKENITFSSYLIIPPPELEG